MKELGIAFKKI